MTVFDWYRLFTWLAWGALVAIVALWGVRIAALITPRAEPAWSALRDGLARDGLVLGAIVASVATAGSLYLSEGGHLQPCRLCWFQRTEMYPLAVILVVAAIRRDAGVRVYALVLAGIGLAVSTWHYLVEWRPSLEGVGGECDPLNPCSVRPLGLRYGFMSIPFMAGLAFALVITVLVLMPRASGAAPTPAPHHDPSNAGGAP